jgi:dephospho-CoA kinase
LKNFNKNKIVGLDIPLLYETGADKQCDYIFLVNTTKKIQKKRVLMRPNMTEEKFELINDSQWSFKKKRLYDRPIIINTSFGKTVTFLIVIFYLFKITIKGK